MNFSTFFNYRATSLAAAVLLLSGCPDKEEQTATDSASGTGTDGGTGDITTSATDGIVTGSTSDNPTGGGTMGGTEGGASTTGTPDSTSGEPGTTSSGTTGGVVDPALQSSCEAICDQFFTCPGFPPVFPDQASCVADCVSSVDGGDPACVDATVALNECAAGMTCQELIDALMSENLGKCQPAQDAADMACAGNTCEGFGGVGPNGCSIGQACPNMPMVEYSCEGDTCTCLVDGVSNGTTCPANGFCDLDDPGQIQAANDCCGFGL